MPDVSGVEEIGGRRVCKAAQGEAWTGIYCRETGGKPLVNTGILPKGKASIKGTFRRKERYRL